MSNSIRTGWNIWSGGTTLNSLLPCGSVWCSFSIENKHLVHATFPVLFFDSTGRSRISTTRRKFPQQELYWPIYVPETVEKIKMEWPLMGRWKDWEGSNHHRTGPCGVQNHWQNFQTSCLRGIKFLWLDQERSRPLDLYSLRPTGSCWCWIVLLSESLGLHPPKLIHIISAHQGPCPVNCNCNLTLTEAFPDQLLFWPNLVTKGDRGLKLKLGEIT